MSDEGPIILELDPEVRELATHTIRATLLEAPVEGVENLAHYEAARAAGATHGQGYFLARPMPLAELEAAPMRHVA